ncbi:MAG: LPXTG cell wall anchor domain-containing protein [Ruminococcus sp.]|nr:LPXTG cell wall anchor domain-containing protein [Ruminococcus sp.]
MSYNAMVILGALVAVSGLYFVIRKKEMRLSGVGLLVGGLLCALWGIFAR